MAKKKEPTIAQMRQALQAKGGFVNENHRKWFSDSKVTNEDGSPKTVYHGTHADVKKFASPKRSHFGFHFGNEEAANNRLEDTAEGRVDQDDVKHFADLSERRYNDLASYQEELNRRNQEVPTEEIAAALERGEDFVPILDKYKYKPTEQEQERLKHLESKWKSANLPIHKFGVGSNIIPAHISLKNPLRLPDIGDWGNIKALRSVLPWNSWAESHKELREEFKKNGYDGIVYRNRIENPVMHSDSYIVLEPTQIKSAIGNRGTFDPKNPDITKADGGSVNMGVNVASDRKAGLRYADLIVDGQKTMESRNSDTLRPYVGKRVAIVRTGEGPAKAIGEVTIGNPIVVGRGQFRNLEHRHLVPEGSAFDIKTATKHLYPLHNPVRYDKERDVGHGIVSRKVVSMADGGVTPQVSDIGFYSPVEAAALNLKRAAGPGQAFRNELTRAPNVNPEEMEWTGMNRFLSSKPNLTKQEIQDFARDNKIDVQEVRLGDNKGETRHASWVLPNGKNYREILLTLPEKDSRSSEEQEFAKLDARMREDGLLSDEAARWEELGRRLGESGRSARNTSNYTSRHWDQPNVLAHMRVNDRWDAENKRMLLIEELQSDWHQQGRERGYKGKVRGTEEIDKELDAHADERSKLLDYAEQLPDSAKEDFSRTMDRIRELEQKMEALRDEFDDARYRERGEGPVPDAPFKENWYQMALKRAIKYAAENGYDRIGLTSGDRQADRYDLSQHVGRVIWDQNAKRFYAYDPELNNRVIDRTGVEAKDLAGLIGKEHAKRLIESEPKESGLRFLDASDLKVGGKGMRKYYDEIYPGFLDKYGKKWGARVGDTHLDIGEERERPLHIKEENGKFHIYDEHPETGEHIRMSKDFETQEQASARRNRMYQGYMEPVKYLDITPEMKAAVMKGQPIYKRGGNVHFAKDVDTMRLELMGQRPRYNGGGSVKAPKKTVKAYKLFRVDPKRPGQLFPLFVDSKTPVKMGDWVDAKEGEMSEGKVKSKIGPLAYRPGWHAGDVPVATHIGEKSDPSLTAPDRRPANHVWAEVEFPDDVDWQSEANRRGTNQQGKVVPVKAHITDRIPQGGHYRYKTNPNMTGNWLIGGSMKVNRVLTDAEVAKINRAAGLADLPRAKPFKARDYGFAAGGSVAPDEWMAEEHINHGK